MAEKSQGGRGSVRTLPDPEPKEQDPRRLDSVRMERTLAVWVDNRWLIRQQHSTSLHHVRSFAAARGGSLWPLVS